LLNTIENFAIPWVWFSGSKEQGQSIATGLIAAGKSVGNPNNAIRIAVVRPCILRFGSMLDITRFLEPFIYSSNLLP
jgi:hypothetical protein